MADTLVGALIEAQARQPETREILDEIIIQPETREMFLSSEAKLFGVESDEKAERKHFRCPRYVGDNIDLLSMGLQINYQNAKGEEDIYIIEDAVQDEGTDDIVFSWKLYRKVTRYKGEVRFIFCATSLQENKIVVEWNTTLAQGTVLEGLEVNDILIEQPEVDVVKQLIQLAEQTNLQSKETNKTTGQILSEVEGLKVELQNKIQEAQDILDRVEQGGNTGGGDEENKPDVVGGGFDVPVGTVISYMGKTVPEGYLICDGTVYNISDYPELSQHFKKDFGSVNFFGGNGTITFAVPDLRGEFLRGTGAASRNTGTGAAVGLHQDATAVPIYSVGSLNGVMNANYEKTNYENYVNIENIDLVLKTRTNTLVNEATKIIDIIDEVPSLGTIRPTNTGVLFCIKCESEKLRKYLVNGETLKVCVKNGICELSMENFVFSDSVYQLVIDKKYYPKFNIRGSAMIYDNVFENVGFIYITEGGEIRVRYVDIDGVYVTDGTNKTVFGNIIWTY